jgi:tetratricopeptide (TPR) repeat protein
MARRDLAQRALERALTLRPDLVETQTARGYFMFVVEGNLEGAESAFRALAAKKPASADATAGLAQILRDRGLQEQSDEYARRTLALDPQNPYRHAIICQDYLTAGEIEVAARTCARANELLPGDVGVLALQATIHQARGELDASRALLRSITAAPGDWRSLRVMTRQLLLDHASGDAVKLLAAYLENADVLGSRRGVVRRWLGDSQRLFGDAHAAEISYRLAGEELEAELGRQPENSTLVAELATVRARLGHRGEAIELSQRCAQLAMRARRDSLLAECVTADIHIELATGTPSAAIARLRAATKLRGALPPLTSDYIRLEPEFAPLHVRAEFKALL